MSEKTTPSKKTEVKTEVEEKKAPEPKPVSEEMADKIVEYQIKLSKIIRKAKPSKDTDASIAKKENIETAMGAMTQFNEIGKGNIDLAKYIGNIRTKMGTLLKDTGVEYKNFTLLDKDTGKDVTNNPDGWLDKEWKNPGDKSFMVSGPKDVVKKGKKDESKSRYKISKGEIIDSRAQEDPKYVEPEYGPREEAELRKKIESGDMTTDEFNKYIYGVTKRSAPAGIQNVRRTLEQGKEDIEKDEKDKRIDDLAREIIAGENPAMSRVESIIVRNRIKNIERKSKESEKRDIYGRAIEEERKSTKSKKPETAEDKEIRERLDYNKEDWEQVKKKFRQDTGYDPISGKGIDEAIRKRFPPEQKQKMVEAREKYKQDMQESTERLHDLAVKSNEGAGASTPIKSISTRKGFTQEELDRISKALEEIDDEKATKRGTKLGIKFDEDTDEKATEREEKRRDDENFARNYVNFQKDEKATKRGTKLGIKFDEYIDEITQFLRLDEEERERELLLEETERETKRESEEHTKELQSTIDEERRRLQEGKYQASRPQYEDEREKRSDPNQERINKLTNDLEEKWAVRDELMKKLQGSKTSDREKMRSEDTKGYKKYLKDDDEKMTERAKRMDKLEALIEEEEERQLLIEEERRRPKPKPLTIPEYGKASEGKYKEERRRPQEGKYDYLDDPDVQLDDSDVEGEDEYFSFIANKNISRPQKRKYQDSRIYEERMRPQEPNNDFLDNRPFRLVESDSDDDNKHNYLPPQKYHTYLRYEEINAFEREIEEKKQYQQERRNQSYQDKRRYTEQRYDDGKDARNIAPDIVEEKQGIFMRNINQFNNLFDKSKKDGFWNKKPKRGDNINSRSEDDLYSRFINDYAEPARQDENKSHFVAGISEYMRANNIRNRVKLNDMGYKAMRGLAEDVGIVGPKSDSWSDKYGINLDLFEELREFGALDPVLNHPRVRNTSAGRGLAELNKQTKGGNTKRPGKLANMGMKFVDIMKAVAVPFRLYAGDYDAAGQLGDLRKGYLAGKSIWEGGKEVYHAAKNEDEEKQVGPESEKSELAEILKKLGNIKDGDGKKEKGGRYPQIQKIANQFRFPGPSQVRNAVPLITNAVTGYMNSINEYGSYYDTDI